MLRILLATFFAAAVAGCAAHSERPALIAPLLIENVRVVDVEGGGIRPGLSILVRDGRIAEVAQRVRSSPGTRRVDGRGKYAIPGLWDMHAHHQVVGEGSLPLFVANGVLGTRDMGGDSDFILPLKMRVRSGAILGPEIVAAGPILDAAPAAWPLRRRVANAAEAKAAVIDLAATGADFIKVHDQTPRDAYFAIAAESGRLGLPFAGHVPASVKIAEAVDAGQKSIEHLSNFRLFLECSSGEAYDPSRCAPLFRRLAEKRVWQTPTLAFMRGLPDVFEGEAIPHAEYASDELNRFGKANAEASKLPPEAIAWFRVQGVAALVAVRDMERAGVPFLAGCDALVPGFCLHDELQWLVRAGFTALEALQAATINPARYLGREASDGAIVPGRNADIVLLDSNPLEDIANIRRIHAVILRGRLLSRGELDAMLARARR